MFNYFLLSVNELNYACWSFPLQLLRRDYPLQQCNCIFLPSTWRMHKTRRRGSFTKKWNWKKNTRGPEPCTPSVAPNPRICPFPRTFCLTTDTLLQVSPVFHRSMPRGSYFFLSAFPRTNRARWVSLSLVETFLRPLKFINYSFTTLHSSYPMLTAFVERLKIDGSLLQSQKMEALNRAWTQPAPSSWIVLMKFD